MSEETRDPIAEGRHAAMTAYLAGPVYQEYKRRCRELDERVGPLPHSKPYDLSGRVIRNGDRVRSTPGHSSGPLGMVIEGIAEHVGEGCPGLGPGPSIICVNGEYSAASLWEVIDQ